MIALHLVVTLALSQQYVRSKVSDSDPNSACLWWKENTRIEFHQNATGNAENPGDAEFEAFGKALSSWQTQLATCGSLSLVDGARSSSRHVGYAEKAANENITVFRTRFCSAVVPTGDACSSAGTCGNDYDCWEHQRGAIAITTTSYTPSTGQILDSDIEFNVANFLFTTVDSPPCPQGQFALDCVATDLQNTATHELGHALGLGHISLSSSTMAPNADVGETKKRTIDTGSAQFICDVYAKGKPAKTCVVNEIDEELGNAVGCGCSTGGEAWVGLGLLAFLRRRR